MSAPARTRTGNAMRALAVSGAGLVALTASVAAAPAAGADDMERASSDVIAMVEAQEWPHYVLGDDNIDIKGAYWALGQNGYMSDENTSEFVQELRDQVLAYQRDNNQFLPVTGDLDEETWLLLREQTYADEYVPGDGRGNDRHRGVRGVQELLDEKHGAEIGDENGEYGEDTFYAVCDAQEHYGLDVDGFVGRLTWRTLITDQDWEGGAGSTEEGAEVNEPTDPTEDLPAAAEEGAETEEAADEDLVAQLSCDDRP